jgi:hypothetical protein
MEMRRSGRWSASQWLQRASSSQTLAPHSAQRVRSCGFASDEDARTGRGVPRAAVVAMRKAVVALGGAGAAFTARALLRRALLMKFRRDVRRLNTGDHRPLLAAYADDAVLVFDEGAHHWSGTHRGKEPIDCFLREFVGAGLQVVNSVPSVNRPSTAPSVAMATASTQSSSTAARNWL